MASRQLGKRADKNEELIRFVYPTYYVVKPEAVLCRCSTKQDSQKCRKIQKKSPVLKSLFNRAAGHPAEVFSGKFSELFKNTFFTEHLWATGSAKFGLVCATKLALALIAYHNIFWKSFRSLYFFGQYNIN